MSKSRIEKNIRLFSWFTVLSEPLFWGPTIIFYLQYVGKMSLPEILTLEAVVMIGAGFLEIPSGALADLIGRKRTMFMGCVFLSSSAIVFALISSPTGAWIGNILWVIGYCLKSGADSAFLYDSLKESGRESEYKKIYGSAQGNKLLALGICSLFLGFLSEINLRIPFFLTIPGLIACCVLTLYFEEPPQEEKYNFRKQIKLTKEGFWFVWKHKKIKWIIAFATLILISLKICFVYSNPYFELTKLKLSYYGLIFFFSNIIAWFFSRNAHAIEEKFEKKVCVIAMVLLVGIPILLMGSVVSQIMISMIFLQNITRGFIIPFIGEFLNRYSDSRKRATIISAKSAVIGIVSFISLKSFSFISKNYSLSFSLQILGISVLIIGTFLIIQYRKIFLKTKSPF